MAGGNESQTTGTELESGRATTPRQQAYERLITDLGRIYEDQNLNQAQRAERLGETLGKYIATAGTENIYQVGVDLVAQDLTNIQEFGKLLSDTLNKSFQDQVSKRQALDEKNGNELIARYGNLQTQALSAINDQVINNANMISTGFNIGGLIGTLMVMYGEFTGEEEWVEKGQKLIDLSEENALKQQQRIEQTATAEDKVNRAPEQTVRNHAGEALNEGVQLDQGIQTTILAPRESQDNAWGAAAELIKGGSGAVPAGNHFQSSVSSVATNPPAPATSTGLDSLEARINSGSIPTLIPTN